MKAALGAICKQGGGLVEGYPITRWGNYAEYRGTVSMFRRAGFKIVAPFGKNNVVMQKRVRARAEIWTGPSRMLESQNYFPPVPE